MSEVDIDAKIESLEEEARSLRAQRRRLSRRKTAVRTPEERSESARKAAQARWDAMTPDEREEALRPMREAAERRSRLRSASGWTEDELDRWLNEAVDRAPKLTAAQREKLADVLSGAV